jgi:membrane associated rhomboid family serine protease
VVTNTLIGICALVFFAQLRVGDTMTLQYGMIPARVLDTTDGGQPIEVVTRQPVRLPDGRPAVLRDGRVAVREVVVEVPRGPLPDWLTPLTCIFLHGSWMHIIGNLWFLYIFGDNVEDRFGHAGFVAFYVVCGLAASLAHLALNPASTAPTIGASGAIAGVMGAYMVLYPRAQVLALIPIFVIFYTFVVPAPVFLGIWFLMQFFSGVGEASQASGAGVAWWAHVGGFVAGAAIALVMRNGPLRPPVQEVRHYEPHVYRVYRQRPHHPDDY